MYRLLYLSSILISLSLTVYLKFGFVVMLESKGMNTRNYSGKELINGMGIVFLIPCLVSVFPLWNLVNREDMFAYIALLLSMTLAGYIDDSLGGSNAKGFKGHLRAVIKGQLSTGMIKIMLSLIMGFFLSLVYFTEMKDIIFNTIFFCLCVNIINLLDLRPGRAIKGFALNILFVSMSSGLKDTWMLLPILSSLAIYIKGELNENYMLGDTGSNLLGGIMGMYILKVASQGVKYILFSILLALNILSEFKSFSEIIESVPILKSLDSFGQLKKGRS